MQGNFYNALAEFLIDLPAYPFAVLKGPTVRMTNDVRWVGRRASMDRRPRLWWDRVSPFDIWWTPGVSDIESANIIHRLRVTRTDLNDLIGLPGYNTDNILAVLQNYGRAGLTENWDSTDASRSVLENRENPVMNLGPDHYAGISRQRAGPHAFGARL